MDDDKIDWSREVTQCGNYLDRFSGHGKNQRDYLSRPKKNKQTTFNHNNKKQILLKKIIPDFDDAKWIEERKKRFPTSSSAMKVERKPEDNVPKTNTAPKKQSEMRIQRKKTLFEKLMEQQ